MRAIGKLLAAVVLVFGLVAIVESQQPTPRGFGGGGPGGNPLSLVQNPAVVKELNLTEEQLKKLPDAVQKALADVLDAKQLKRLNQIQLQQRGTNALTDPKVASALKLSDSQRDKIKTIQEDSRKEMAELFKGGGGREAFQKIAGMRKETQEKLQSVLTDDQKKAWNDLLGEELKLQPFGGAGGGQKKGRLKKKTDAE